MGIPWDGMGWDRHKLLWDGTEKYVPWTSLCFLFTNSLTTIYSKTVISSSSRMSCKSLCSKTSANFRLTEIREECDWLRLETFCRHQSTRAYYKGRAYIKIILKNHARSYYWKHGSLCNF